MDHGVMDGSLIQDSGRDEQPCGSLTLSSGLGLAEKKGDGAMRLRWFLSCSRQAPPRAIQAQLDDLCNVL